ncbi:hypothetical protein [Halorubrum tibetense]|uniref:Uncharacterized protein n=1 Tax=Halorubrum tibetense TaxID=175631 RepID=A0ABD5S6R8_9EURY
MPETGPQRLGEVGPVRTVGYGLLVGSAAYLLAAVYGPSSPGYRIALAVAIAALYIGAVHAVGLLRRRRVGR